LHNQQNSCQAALVVANSGSGDDDGYDDKLSFSFKDTGSLKNDNITNDNTITINGLKEGETWRYSTDDGATFKLVINRSFTLDVISCSVSLPAISVAIIVTL
jgi:hypothetical protein